jgi:hypothetical protein
MARGEEPMTVRATTLLLGLVASTVLAQERPSEDALFGAPPDAGTPSSTAPAPASPAVIPSAPGPDRNTAAGEQQILTGSPTQDAFAAGLVKEDALKIGGQFYMRAITTFAQNQPLKNSSFNVPTLLDVYLDARPTDRLRAFVLGRMAYDPLLGNSTVVTGVPSSVTTSFQTVSNPAVYLDQAWLAFDIARSVFVTAGRQHAKWGTGQYFNPDDFLASQPRDPLAVFDARLGVSMLRVQVPWERTGLSFTAVAVFEPTQNISTTGTTVGSSGGSVNLISGNQNTSNGLLQDVGGAGQIEYDFKGGAVGINGLGQKNRAWRLGAYTTAGIGDFDVYGEAVVKQCLDLPNMSPNTRCGVSNSTDIIVPGVYAGYPFGDIQQPSSSPLFQAVAGLTYAINFEGNKSITLGAEYFYNRASFTASQYPNLIFQGAYQPFYLGRNYLAVSATLIDTTAKTTWVLTNIANFTDVSFITRLDFLVTVLSYLQVESFAAVDYGHLGGEFRLGFDILNLPINTSAGPVPFHVVVHAPIVQLGLGLRLAL